MEGRKSVEQVKNLWNTQWSKYKAVRRRENHTGGGDGDIASDAGTDPEGKEAAEEEGGNADVKESDENLEGTLTDAVDIKPLNMKRKRASTKGTTERKNYTKLTLDAFENSEIYCIIDRV